MRINLYDLLGEAFYELAEDVKNHGHTHYDLSGGRGSLKSSAISLMIPPLMISRPGTHACVFRKVGNTIRDSVFSQYIWAIDKLGMSDLWDAKTSPQELIYKPTKQRILFRGADDPMKLKSIKAPFGYIAFTHFEEKDQFAGRKEIRNILQSTMRGGSEYWNFESYNPPITRDNWANIDSQEVRADRLCHKSTYLQALEQQANMRGLNIRFTDLRPGFVATPLLGDNPKYPMLLETKKVAHEMVYAVNHRKHVRVIDWRWRIATAMWRRIPKWLWRRLNVQ